MQNNSQLNATTASSGTIEQQYRQQPPTAITGSGTTTSLSNSPTLASATTSSNSISSYASWTVPSLEGFHLARRASALGARYGLLSSRSATLKPNKTSPAPSGMSVMMEGGATGVAIQNKARKMSLRMSDSITSALNDSSLVLYRVNEHIHKKVPQLVEEKKALVTIRKNLETANQDLEDARQTISGIERITELGAIEELLKRSLAAVQQK